MDMPVNVPVDDPNADTEWNDILRKHGVIPEKPPSPTPMIEEALTEARRLAHVNRLEGKTLDELDELEDDEDDDFLEKYRQQRMTELNDIAKASVHGQVYPLQKPDYARDVTDASHKTVVFVLMTSSLGTNTESSLLTTIWRELAQKYGELRFCQIRADLCIEGYPERNTPTVLVYKDGDIRKQLVTLKEMKGAKTSVGDFEKLLVELEAVSRTDERLVKRDDEEDGQVDAEKSLRIRRGRNAAVGESKEDGDDSDWD